MCSKQDYFKQPVSIGDRVLVSTGNGYPNYFRVATVLRFTEKSIVISRHGTTAGKKPLYVKPDEIVKMTEELNHLDLYRILVT